MSGEGEDNSFSRHDHHHAVAQSTVSYASLQKETSFPCWEKSGGKEERVPFLLLSSNVQGVKAHWSSADHWHRCLSLPVTATRSRAHFFSYTLLSRTLYSLYSVHLPALTCSPSLSLSSPYCYPHSHELDRAVVHSTCHRRWRVVRSAQQPARVSTADSTNDYLSKKPTMRVSKV